MKERKYVFVVVGKKEHISELNQSVKTLKYFSTKEIIVITDLQRNEAGIEHENVIDVRTPENYTDHQAAIFIKTGLHHYLDMSHDYCYLDGDVLVIRENADKIFDHFVLPITFCTDHCRLQEFSEAAIHSTFDPDIINKRQKLKALFDSINKNPRGKKSASRTFIDNKIQTLLFRITYFFASFILILRYLWGKDKQLRVHKKSRLAEHDTIKRTCFVWLYEKIYHEPYHSYYYFLREGFKHDKENYRWTDNQGNIILWEKSDNLAYQIRQKFNIDIKEKNWQHWNGGVFLFNAESVEFMENWHQWTNSIFCDKNWLTRDQGTLVAVVWKFGLENHSTIPVEYNFIADYNHPTMKYYGDLTFGFQNNPIVIKPIFLHVYHHWGDKNWPVWQDLNKIVLSKIN